VWLANSYKGITVLSLEKYLQDVQILLFYLSGGKKENMLNFVVKILLPTLLNQ
jgi:hypothetical protein